MITYSTFQPTWWLRSPHLQTIWPTLFRPRPRLSLRNERLELDDGDFIDLAWTAEQSGPLVLFIHGLEGNLRSHYATGMLQRLQTAGLQCVFMHLRGCGSEMNRLARRYHSGETADPIQVITHLRTRYPTRPLYAIGISAGGNILLKLLGERGDSCVIERAMAISVPFDLAISSRTLGKGIARLYQAYLMRSLRRYLGKSTHKCFPPRVRLEEGLASRSLIEFDDAITAPMFGFLDAADYYHRASCRDFLPSIQTTTLIVHACDDPFMTTEVIPTASELPECVTLELAQHGGHVGFISGNDPCRLNYWLEQRALDFFTSEA